MRDVRRCARIDPFAESRNFRNEEDARRPVLGRAPSASRPMSVTAVSETLTRPGSAPERLRSDDPDTDRTPFVTGARRRQDRTAAAIVIGLLALHVPAF